MPESFNAVPLLVARGCHVGAAPVQRLWSACAVFVQCLCSEEEGSRPHALVLALVFALAFAQTFALAAGCDGRLLNGP
jgi:hypothetical protein